MAQWKRAITARNTAALFSLAFLGFLLHYFFTGAGGPLKLATRLVPMALVLYTLKAYADDELYPRLGPLWNKIIAGVYILAAAIPFVYLELEFENLFIFRSGSYNTTDIVIGTILFLLVMEISRKVHPVLFGVNVVLFFYTLYGAWSPIDFFWHPGASLTRIITSSTVEMATGVYGRYAQLALTLIASFLLMAAVAKGFEAQGALLRVIRSWAGQHRRNIPQTAVLSSLTVGMVSGSGAANTAVTGSFTIPLMKQHGISGVFAAAVETSASMGGLIMPPLMAAAAFIIADFLGVPYWDVVARGFAVAFVFFVVLIFSVYLIGVRQIRPDTVTPPPVPTYDKVKTGIFFASIALLVVFMGVLNYSAMRSALYAAGILLGALLLVHLYYKYVARHPDFAAESLLKNFRSMLETYADLTSYIVVLMSILGIMIGLFTITGFILRMGQFMLNLGEGNLLLVILMAWAFGWLSGMGLPPTATYIIVAVIIAPPMIGFGIDPWIAHFFAFLLAVWGELTPPTSLTAAVAASIAEAPFVRTTFEALRISAPLLLMTFAIFVRQGMVVEQGWAQIPDTLLVAVGSLGLAFAFFGRFSLQKAADIGLRTGLGLLSLVTVFYPAQWVAGLVGVVVAAVVIGGVRRLLADERLQHDGTRAVDDVA